MPKTDVVPFNKDALDMMGRDRAATVVHMALDPINQLPPHEQMAAISILFATFTAAFGLDPEDMHRYGRKLLQPERFHDKPNAQLDALTAFAGLQKTGTL